MLPFILLASVATAQYYYVPYQGAGTNPAGLNTDGEFPVGGGLAATWTVLAGPSAIPAWSPWTAANIEILKKVQRRAVNLISGLNGVNYEEKLLA